MATEATTSRPSRVDRVTDLVVGLLLLLGAVWGGVNAGTATSGRDDAPRPRRDRVGHGGRGRAPVQLGRHGRRLRRAADAPRRAGGLATPRRTSARRCRRGRGRPADPTAPPERTAGRGGRRCRCCVAVLALAGLFALGLAAFGRRPGAGDGGAGALSTAARARRSGPGPTGDRMGPQAWAPPRCSMCSISSAGSAEPLSGPASSSERAPVAPRCSSS